MKVVVAVGICVERDAISAAAANQAELIASIDGVEEVTLVAQAIGRRCGVRSIVASDGWDFLRLNEVRDADVVIYHWGIRYDIFESLPLVAGDGTRTIVHFHNLTPIDLVPPDVRDVIAYSEMQFQLAALTGSELWADSEHNIDRLVDWGFDRSLVRYMPFPIERPRSSEPVRRSGDRVKFLNVGRVVPSKGVHDLIEAMAEVRDALGDRVALTCAGDTVLSSSGYAGEVRATIGRHDLEGVVDMRADVDDIELWRLFDQAHVVVSPSYHEGLCVPIVEGYIAGCRAIGTDAGNLPYIVQPPDPIVPVARPDLLARAMIDLGASVLDGTSSMPSGAATVVDAHSSDRIRARLIECLASPALGGDAQRSVATTSEP